jgi:hypothetical protein
MDDLENALGQFRLIEGEEFEFCHGLSKKIHVNKISITFTYIDHR